MCDIDTFNWNLLLELSLKEYKGYLSGFDGKGIVLSDIYKDVYKALLEDTTKLLVISEDFLENQEVFNGVYNKISPYLFGNIGWFVKLSDHIIIKYATKWKGFISIRRPLNDSVVLEFIKANKTRNFAFWTNLIWNNNNITIHPCKLEDYKLEMRDNIWSDYCNSFIENPSY